MTSFFRPTYQLEAEFAQFGPVIGVDEAGRGPWAGPVTAAAFWIFPDSLTALPDKLRDSKKLSSTQRADIETQLFNPQFQHIYAVQHSSVAEIDEMGILPATFKAMCAAVEKVALQLSQNGYNAPACVLVDGNLLPPLLPYRAKAIIKGDSRSLSIAAASILAKQSRDRVMSTLSAAYPMYGWEQNAGYGTKSHQLALNEYGVTPHHRRSYAPIKRLLKTG
tara:strand:- start:10 stop:672 length:663 start_codon:yes stop_codon:yes gene_type:complete